MRLNMTPSYCRLFIATPVPYKLAQIEEALAGAIKGGDIASLLIRGQNNAALKKSAEVLTGMAQRAGIAVLIEDDAELALACGADGVEVSAAPGVYDAARQKLGADRIVGVACGNDRHSAMVAGEAGADYVVFGRPGADDLGEQTGMDVDSVWWAKLFEVPCVEARPLKLDQARELVAAGVDFIGLPDEMWESAASAGALVAEYNGMIGDTKIALD